MISVILSKITSYIHTKHHKANKVKRNNIMEIKVDHTNHILHRLREYRRSPMQEHTLLLTSR
jgi:hypothetical protein